MSKHLLHAQGVMEAVGCLGRCLAHIADAMDVRMERSGNRSNT